MTRRNSLRSTGSAMLPSQILCAYPWHRFRRAGQLPYPLHFSYPSWINQVERWLSTLTTKQIRRGTDRSTRQLEDAIRNHLHTYNTDPNPFAWTTSADGILANMERFLSATFQLTTADLRLIASGNQAGDTV